MRKQSAVRFARRSFSVRGAQKATCLRKDGRRPPTLSHKMSGSRCSNLFLAHNFEVRALVSFGFEHTGTYIVVPIYRYSETMSSQRQTVVT